MHLVRGFMLNLPLMLFFFSEFCRIQAAFSKQDEGDYCPWIEPESAEPRGNASANEGNDYGHEIGDRPERLK